MKQFLLVLFSLSACCIYAQQWEQVASLPASFRTDHSFGFSLNGKGYLVTGSDGSNYFNDFYEYDSNTDVWTAKADFPGAARGFAIGDTYEGKAYFGFGASNAGRLDDLWVYDPDADTWTELAPCECAPRTHPAMVAVSGKIFVGLGGSPTGDSNDWWAYDIETNTWEQRASFPDLQRHHPYQFHDGTYAYVGFGHGGPNIFNEWFKYDHINDVWEEMATLPAEGRVAGAQFSYKGLGFILSGDGDNHSYMDTGEFWVYYPERDEWQQLTPHPGRSRWAPASFVLNDEVYLVNGWNSLDGYFANNWKFALSTVTDPRLSFESDDQLLLNGSTNPDYCDKVETKSINISTPFVFGGDVEVSISVDAASTAAEGRDFILPETTKTLPAGDQSLTFELLVFDDEVAGTDKTLILNMTSDSLVQTPQLALTIVEDDEALDLASDNSFTSIGNANTTTDAVLRGFYDNSTTQVLYTKELLAEQGLTAGTINEIRITVEALGSNIPYSSYRIAMANTARQSLITIDNSTTFVDVYDGSYDPTLGEQTFVLSTPFVYDGEGGIMIQFCSDNSMFSQSDIVTSTSVSYPSLASLFADDVDGCSYNGQTAAASVVPDITFVSPEPAKIYDRLGAVFTSTIDEGEAVYFSSTDSVYAKVDNADTEMCISSSLATATGEAIDDGDLTYIDRLYQWSTDVSDADMNMTLLMPKVAGINFDSENLKALYTTSTAAPYEWVQADVIAMTENSSYVTLTVPYMGDGSYTVGGSSITTSTADLTKVDMYDDVQIYDVAGRLIATSKASLTDGSLRAGIYIASYTYQGNIVKSEKVFVRGN